MNFMVHEKWDKVLFLHWRVPISLEPILIKQCPFGSEIERFDGSLWIGLVLLTERGVGPGISALRFGSTGTDNNSIPISSSKSSNSDAATTNGHYGKDGNSNISSNSSGATHGHGTATYKNYTANTNTGSNPASNIYNPANNSPTSSCGAAFGNFQTLVTHHGANVRTYIKKSNRDTGRIYNEDPLIKSGITTTNGATSKGGLANSSNSNHKNSNSDHSSRGIYFFSLECDSVFATYGANAFGIPYKPASITRNYSASCSCGVCGSNYSNGHTHSRTSNHDSTRNNLLMARNKQQDASLVSQQQQQRPFASIRSQKTKYEFRSERCKSHGTFLRRSVSNLINDKNILHRTCVNSVAINDVTSDPLTALHDTKGGSIIAGHGEYFSSKNTTKYSCNSGNSDADIRANNNGNNKSNSSKPYTQASIVLPNDSFTSFFNDSEEAFSIECEWEISPVSCILENSKSLNASNNSVKINKKAADFSCSLAEFFCERYAVCTRKYFMDWKGQVAHEPWPITLDERILLQSETNGTTNGHHNSNSMIAQQTNGSSDNGNNSMSNGNIYGTNNSIDNSSTNPHSKDANSGAPNLNSTSTLYENINPKEVVRLCKLDIRGIEKWYDPPEMAEVLQDMASRDPDHVCFSAGVGPVTFGFLKPQF